MVFLIKSSKWVKDAAYFLFFQSQVMNGSFIIKLIIKNNDQCKFYVGTDSYEKLVLLFSVLCQ